MRTSCRARRSVFGGSQCKRPWRDEDAGTVDVAGNNSILQKQRIAYRLAKLPQRKYMAVRIDDDDWQLRDRE